MEDEPINQNYLIGCDTIENSPSFLLVIELGPSLFDINNKLAILQLWL